MSVGNININREAPSLICTHTHTCIVEERERRRDREGGGPVSLIFWLICLGFGLSLDETLFFGHSILVIYIEEVLLGFFPLGFPRVNYYVPCDSVSFSDPLYVVIMKMY